MTPRKRPPKPRVGRPCRALGQPTSTLGLRLTRLERALLAALAARWGCSEPDAARRAIELAWNGNA